MHLNLNRYGRSSFGRKCKSEDHVISDKIPNKKNVFLETPKATLRIIGQPRCVLEQRNVTKTN